MTRSHAAILCALAFLGLGASLASQAPSVTHPAANNPHLGNRAIDEAN